MSENPTIYAELATPLGNVLLGASEEGALKFLRTPREDQNNVLKGCHSDQVPQHWREDRKTLAPALKQVDEYFRGKRKTFDLSMDPEGTAFQKKVWDELLRIPYGMTTSYGEIAKAMGRPTASRAIGAANGKNPIAIIVPCHRVIGKDGSLTGYAGGLDVKRALLQLEKLGHLNGLKVSSSQQ